MTASPSSTLVLCLGVLALSSLTACSGANEHPAAPVAAAAAQKGGEELSGPYEPVASWPRSLDHSGYTWGSMGGVFAESPDRVYLLMRGELPVPPQPFEGYPLTSPATSGQPRLQNCILIVNRDGKVVETWTQHDHLFLGGRGPHKIKINPYDPDKHVWIIDDQKEQIFEFTHDGKQLVRTLGEAGVAGNDETHFAGPTDIAWLPDGTFFVTDGYVNSRVVKFDPGGKFLKTWGTKGKGPGQFDLPHAIDIDKARRLYVADRVNGRVQIFDEMGTFVEEWGGMVQPFHLLVTPDQHVWVSDGFSNKFLQYDSTGRLLSSFGTFGTLPGTFFGVHQFSVDSDGNLYVAEAFGGRAQKLAPRKGVDASTLVPAMTPTKVGT